MLAKVTSEDAQLKEQMRLLQARQERAEQELQVWCSFWWCSCGVAWHRVAAAQTRSRRKPAAPGMPTTPPITTQLLPRPPVTHILTAARPPGTRALADRARGRGGHCPSDAGGRALSGTVRGSTMPGGRA